MRFPWTSSKTYKTIEPWEEEAILDLAREHPEMGRRRLHAALAQQGVEVDSFWLKQFLRDHDLITPPDTPQRRLPFHLESIKHHPWLGRE
jgi:hypothetical protein